MKTTGSSYSVKSLRDASSAEDVFLCGGESGEYRIECADGLVLIVHSPTRTADCRVNLTVGDVQPSGRRDMQSLKGSVLRFPLGSRFSPQTPVTCIAELSDGVQCVLRVPGVKFVG